MRARSRLLLLWIVTACLAFGMPLQSVTSAIAGLLGARHTHRTTAAPSVAEGSMAGWKDFRRAQYDAPKGAFGQDHAQLHRLGARHHHDLLDDSVVERESLSDGDGALGDMLQAGAAFVFVPATDLAPIMAPAGMPGDAWRILPAAPFRSIDPRRIERPPQALA